MVSDKLAAKSQNRNVAVSGMLQLSGIKDAGRVFRLYIKSRGDKAL
jgi:hypothetical protein